ncbi:MAG TPA: hypothetical protein VN971_09535, partial [Thermoanaerobaculia bacterium]|nr:hypothetical protein [Thermoanaerobaculia bacterium]
MTRGRASLLATIFGTVRRLASRDRPPLLALLLGIVAVLIPRLGTVRRFTSRLVAVRRFRRRASVS